MDEKGSLIDLAHVMTELATLTLFSVDPKHKQVALPRSMVLWEIALATAYWLGIRRTYRIALKLQRRLVSPKHPRLRLFLHRRTRNVFDVALSVHKGIQQRDLSAGKSIGNYILKFLDRARPSADIRGVSCKVQNPTVKLSSSCQGNLKSENSLVGKSSQSDDGPPNRLLFSRYDISRTQIAPRSSNRYNIGNGRICPGTPSTRTVPGTRAYFDVVSAPRLLPRRNIFRDDIAEWMARN